MKNMLKVQIRFYLKWTFDILFFITSAIPIPTATTIPTIAKIISNTGKACPIYCIKTPRPAPAPSIVPQTPEVSFTGHEIVNFSLNPPL